MEFCLPFVDKGNVLAAAFVRSSLPSVSFVPRTVLSGHDDHSQNVWLARVLNPTSPQGTPALPAH